MTFSAEASTGWFTPEKAENALPLVRAIVADIAQLRESVKVRQARVDEMLLARGETASSPYQDELEAMRRSLEGDRKRITEYARELSAIGVEILESDPIAEFPAWVEHRAVRLCWTLGGDGIQFWRELDDSITQRRTIEGVVFADGPVGDGF